jgi:hypothetical protein
MVLRSMAAVASSENLEATWVPGVAVPNLYGGPPPVSHTWNKDQCI